MYTDQWGRQHRYGPPLGYVMPPGVTRFGPEEWEAAVARGLDFPPLDLTTPVQTMRVRGSCMYPLLVEGRDAMLVRPVSPDEALVDGGLYLIQWTNVADIDAYESRTGMRPTHIVKFLRYIGWEWFYQCAEGLARLDGIVLGVVIGVVPVAGSSPDAPTADARGANIVAHAATVTYSGSAAGPNTYNAGTVPTAYITTSCAAIDASSIVKATVTADIVQTVAGSIAQMWLIADWGAGNQSSDICNVNVVGSAIRCTVQSFFPAIPAATAFSIKVRVGCSASASFTITNTNVLIEVIKR